MADARATISPTTNDRKKMTHKITVLSIILSLCLVACVPGHNDYSEFTNIPVNGWDYRAPIEFTPQISDSSATGKLIVALRHSNAYIYSNIWIELRRYSPDSSLTGTDTMNIKLADMFGQWYGTGLGTDYQITDTLPSSVTLSQGSRIMIRHIMRQDTLPAIEQIGILFKES